MTRIAIVEDEAAVREQLAGYVQRYTRQYGTPFEVTEFADGMEILEDYRPQFDIIFLDVEMKHLDGMETARRIREREPELPIVILTRPDFDFHAECAPRREIIRATYEHAKAAGDENVYFLDGERFFGDEDRDACTNDCTHPNDLGMYRMAKVIEPVLRGILERAK